MDCMLNMNTARTRRHFHRIVAGAGCSAATLLFGESTESAGSTPRPSTEADARSIEPDAAATERPDASVAATHEELLALALLLQYPMADLDDERLAGLRAGLARNRHLGDILRPGLTNADEPATVFVARTFGQG